MKKILIILLVIIFLISVVYLVTSSKNKESQPTISPAKPNIPSYITGSLPILFNIKKEDFNFPTRLPLISVSPKVISKENAIEISKNLGFKDIPQEFNDINEGIKYYWTSDTHSLVITPKTGTIKYNFASEEVPNTVNKNLSDAELVKTASEFLKEL